ncbi:hypothetical protein [Methanoculleus sp.]|uniref:hypothetical protein n=1 Tax=Methanoculleus sp. TaxID=90427 RepID=UPI0025DE0445|nr:hypothetical protein [Methanoculleus sp.]MCK9319645.1 hypothetical protein [Methanoculleus sp.]
MKTFYTIEFTFHYYEERCKPHFQYDSYDDALKMYKRICKIVNGASERKMDWLKEQCAIQGCYGFIEPNKPINLVKTTIEKEIVK